MKPTASQRIGALDDHTLVYEGDAGQIHTVSVPPLAAPDGFYLLAEVMERRNLAQLWIHPAFAVSRCLDTWPSYFHLAVLNGWTINPSEVGPWVYAYREGTYGARQIAFTHREDRADWRTAKHARELFEAVILLRDVLAGHSYRRSPGAFGTYLMRALHQGPRATELDAPADMPPPAAQSNTETPWLWIRALTAVERARRYVHGYDRNGAYLAACASLPLGVGAASHVTGSAASDLFHMDRAPGYWRVDGAWARPHAGLLPHPLSRAASTNEDGPWWVTTPTLLMAQEVGAHLAIEEGWVWRQSAQYLNPWYKLLRDGRKMLMSRGPDDHAARIALDALKATYAVGIGWLDGSWQRTAAQEGHAGTLYRPDWRHAIIATSNANLYRRVLQCAQENPQFAPFAFAHDAIYVVSDEPDARKAAPAALKLGTGLGEWKVIADGVPLASVVRDVLVQERPNLYAFQRALRERMAVKAGGE